jgi:quercetin dioxygenase-like cupin family protein
MTVPYLAQAAEHEQLQWLEGGVMRIMLDGEKTGGQLMMQRQGTQRESASPVHVHDREDETVVLLQGSGIWWAGDQRWELSEGGVAFLPRNVPHAYRLTSPTVDMLTVCTPAGAATAGRPRTRATLPASTASRSSPRLRDRGCTPSPRRAYRYARSPRRSAAVSMFLWLPSLPRTPSGISAT